MQILGIDFTSAPNRHKPITCAVGELTSSILHIETVLRLPTFADFENTLAQSGPWIAGFDFPFSQPRRLIESLGWPTNWAEMVELVASMGKEAFSRKSGVMPIHVHLVINCIVASPMSTPMPSVP